MTHFEFGLFYERKENFLLAIYYYKQNFECLLKNNAHQIDLMRTYSFIGKMYEKLNYHIAALQIYIRILVIEFMSDDRSLLRKYEIIIKYLQRLVNCKCSRKLKYYFRLLMSSSIIFILFYI